MQAHRTTFSIVTVVKNAASTISDCIESVRRQNLPAEHIFIDGCSTDGTLEIIERCASDTTRIVSEPDRGIYDAMNKGLALATGDVVGTLNSDDMYAHDGVLKKVSAVFEDENIEATYGDLIYVKPDDTSRVIRYWRSKPFSPELYYRGWMPPHPTFFVRRSIYEKFGGFKIDLGSAADYELTLRFLLKHRINSAYIPGLIVVMRAGGTSNASLLNRLKAHRYDRIAWKVNGLTPKPWTLIAKPLSKIGQYFRWRNAHHRSISLPATEK